MTTSHWFSRVPRPITRRLYPLIRYTSLMRALELRLLMPWMRDVKGWRVLDVRPGALGHGLAMVARKDGVSADA